MAKLNAKDIQLAFESLGADFFEKIAYEGFNPLVIRNILSKKESNLAILTTDLAHIIAIFITRGTNLTKIAGKSSATGKELILGLKRKYSIEDPGVSLKKNTIIMSRIAASFPEEVVKAIHSCASFRSPVVNLPPDFAEALKTPIAAAIIPKNQGDITAILLDAHFDFCSKLDVIINPKDPTTQERLKQYQMAAFNSNILDEDARINICMEVDILNVDDKNRLQLITCSEYEKDFLQRKADRFTRKRISSGSEPGVSRKK